MSRKLSGKEIKESLNWPENVDEVSRIYYEVVVPDWRQFLKPHSISLPALTIGKDGGREYTNHGLHLVLFGSNQGRGVHHRAPVGFAKKFGLNDRPNQQPRHLKYDGFNLLTGGNSCGILPHDVSYPCGAVRRKGEKNHPEYNVLVNLTSFSPSFKKNKRGIVKGAGALDAEAWEEIQEMWDYICAYCRREDLSQTLDRGHINPTLSLTKNNVVPLCRPCNNFQGDNFSWKISNGTLRIGEIHNPEFLAKIASQSVIEQALGIPR